MEPINLTSAEWHIMECLWEAAPQTGRKLSEKMEVRMGLNDPTQSSSLIDLFELGRVIQLIVHYRFELPLLRFQGQNSKKRPFCGRKLERSFLKISHDLSGVCLLVSSKPSKRRPFSFPDVKKGVSAQSITRPEHFRMLRLIFLLTRRTSQ